MSILIVKSSIFKRTALISSVKTCDALTFTLKLSPPMIAGAWLEMTLIKIMKNVVSWHMEAYNYITSKLQPELQTFRRQAFP
jgi:hypothetical protein